MLEKSIICTTTLQWYFIMIWSLQTSLLIKTWL